MSRTFEQFVKEVHDSCEGHAKRKNYTTQDINGDNQLANVLGILKIDHAHGIGEIIYKVAEFLRDPKPLLMVKTAGWAWIIWRSLPEEKKSPE
jgi:hypothetical protein